MYLAVVVPGLQQATGTAISSSSLLSYASRDYGNPGSKGLPMGLTGAAKDEGATVIAAGVVIIAALLVLIITLQAGEFYVRHYPSPSSTCPGCRDRRRARRARVPETNRGGAGGAAADRGCEGGVTEITALPSACQGHYPLLLAASSLLRVASLLGDCALLDTSAAVSGQCTQSDWPSVPRREPKQTRIAPAVWAERSCREHIDR